MKKQLYMILLAGALGFTSSTATAGGKHAHEHDETEAIGQPGQASAVGRTIEVDMSDTMRFTPSRMSVKRGETVRFVVRNSGRLRHEFVLGTRQALLAHYEVMKKHPEMEHADPNSVTVEPGKTGEVIWRFTKSGRVDIGCLQPGHYDAGMKGQITVATTSPSVSAKNAKHHHGAAHAH